MVPRRWMIGLLIATLVFVLLACGPLGSSSPTATKPPAVAAATATPTAAKAVTEGEQATAAPTAAPQSDEVQATSTPAPSAEEATVTTEPTTETVAEGEDVVLPDMQTSLEGVVSYSAVMVVSIRTADQAEGEGQSFNILEEADRQAEAYRLVMDGVGQDAQPFKMEVITIGQDSWIAFGEGWMHTKADESSSFTAMADSFLAQGDTMMDSAEKPRKIGSEEVNGVMTDHYRWDQTTFESIGSNVKGYGDVWIAQDNDLMMKMVFHAEGEVTGTDGEQGVMDMTWEVRSINQPVTIAPPEELSGENALPAMEGAEDSESFLITQDMLIYDIEATIEDVVAFYDSALAEQGWEKDAESSTTSEEYGSVTYKKGTETLNLLVSLSTDKEGFVSVMLTRQSEGG